VKDPETPSDWQNAVDAAGFYRLVADARMYGLLEGGPEVNIERCDELLRRGAALGFKPKSVAELIKNFL